MFFFFFGKFGVLCFLISFVLRISLFPYHRRIHQAITRLAKASLQSILRLLLYQKLYLLLT